MKISEFYYTNETTKDNCSSNNRFKLNYFIRVKLKSDAKNHIRRFFNKRRRHCPLSTRVDGAFGVNIFRDKFGIVSFV